MSNMDVLTLPEVIWHIGPSNMHWQDLLNLWKSSNNVSLDLHFGGTGGVTLVRLNKLYSFMIFTFGSCFNGGGGGGIDSGNPPVAPVCSGVSTWPLSIIQLIHKQLSSDFLHSLLIYAVPHGPSYCCGGTNSPSSWLWRSEYVFKLIHFTMQWLMTINLDEPKSDILQCLWWVYLWPT